MSILAQHLNIVQITDLHILEKSGDTLLGLDTEYYFKAVMQHAFEMLPKIDLILLTGDLTQTPYLDSYKRILQQLRQYKIPAICLPGNHDDLQLMQAALNADNVSCSKQTLLGNWQFICLNSQIPGEQGGYINDEEMTFLRQCLEQYPHYFACIATHHHSLAINSAWMDTMKIENGEQLIACMQQYPQTKLLINGHIHQAYTAVRGHIKIYGTPSTCFQFKPLSEHFELDRNCPGYRFIKLYDNGDIESEVSRLSGQLNDLKLTSHGY